MLVTGASGAVGSAVVGAFQQAGARVRTLQRSRLDLPGAEHMVGDVTSPHVLAPAVAGMDVVVHLAGLLHVVDPPPSMEQEYRRVNDEGTATLVRVAVDARVRRIVYASTIAVYGHSNVAAPPLMEMATCRPDTSYARTKLAGERHVLASVGQRGAPSGVVLRLAAVYGPGVKGNYRRLVQALAHGRYLPIGAGTNRRTLVHEADAAAAFVLASQHPAASDRIFNVTDGCVHQVREIVDAIAAALGRRAPRVHVPVSLARSGALGIEVLARAIGREPPVTRSSIDKLVEDIAVDGTAIVGALGYTPRMDLEAGWADVIARMRAAGVLARGATL